MSKKTETEQEMVYVGGGAVMSLVPKKLVEGMADFIKEIKNTTPVQIFIFDK